MMQIFYASFIRFPGEKAHALYVAKVMEAFSEKVADVRIIVPRRYGVVRENFKTFYNLKKDISLVRLPCIDLLWLPVFKSVAHTLGVLTFALSTYFYIQRTNENEAILFTNDALVALILSYSKVKVIYEIHDYPQASWWFYRWVGRRVHKVQTNNKQKVSKAINDFKVPLEKIYFVYNGVTVEDFDIPVSKEEARKKLGLEINKKYAVYAGHLYDWKGADVLAEAARHMPNVHVLFVGGTKQDVEHMSSKYANLENVNFLGYKNHREIPYYLKAADVLVLPNSAKSELSLYHTSPMKLFEYMASKRPIVASDLPSIREIVSESEVIYAEPDHSIQFAEAIQFTILNYPQNVSEALFVKAKKFSWVSRADKILNSFPTMG